MKMHSLTFGDENLDEVRVGVGRSTAVISRVGQGGAVDDKAAVGFGPGLGADGDAAARRVVVDHPLVVVPEHILRRRGTLQHTNTFH